MEFASEPQKGLMIKMGIPFPANITKQEASKLIDEKVNQSNAQSQQKLERKSSYASYSSKKPDTNFYVSYAKDLCIAMYEFNADKVKDLTLDQVMESAIVAIRMAKDAFTE